MLGAFFIFAGLVAIACSAGDCDGKCMEYANTLEEMMIICFIGLTLLVTGGIIIYKENQMGKVKNYMMDIEENVYDLEGLEDKISESEDISEVKSWVVDQLGLKTHFDIGIAEGAVTEMWNELGVTIKTAPTRER